MSDFPGFQRPAERVEQFLKEYLDRQTRHEGERLPSTRAIARKLQISEGTVRNVLKRWQDGGVLQARGGSGVYLSRKIGSGGRIHIGTNAGVISFSHFGGYAGQVLQYAFHATMKLGAKAALTSIFTEAEYDEVLSEEAVRERCEGLDAMLISVMIAHSQTIAQWCREKGKPYIFLNAPDHLAVTNFISPDHYTSFHRLAAVFRATGRKRWAVLLYPEIDRLGTIRQRLGGLFAAVGYALGVEIEVRLAACDHWVEEAGARAMRGLLESGYEPDLVLTPGDLLAIGAIRVLEERGFSLPEAVSVIAGGGVEPEAETLGLTRLVQPVEELGSQSVAMLVEMMEKGLLEVPGRYLEIGLTTGTSTTARENEALTAAFTQTPPGLQGGRFQGMTEGNEPQSAGGR